MARLCGGLYTIAALLEAIKRANAAAQEHNHYYYFEIPEDSDLITDADTLMHTNTQLTQQQAITIAVAKKLSPNAATPNTQGIIVTQPNSTSKSFGVTISSSRLLQEDVQQCHKIYTPNPLAILMSVYGLSEKAIIMTTGRTQIEALITQILDGNKPITEPTSLNNKFARLPALFAVDASSADKIQQPDHTQDYSRLSSR